MLPNVSTFVGFYRTVDNIKYGDPVFDPLYSTYPSEDNIAHAKLCARSFRVFYLLSFFSTSSFRGKEPWSFQDHSLVCSIHGRARFAMEGKSVLPMHRGPFVDMGEVCLKWADNLWYVGSASNQWFLALFGPVAEY